MVFLRIPDVGNPLGEPEIDSPGREREIVSPPTTHVPNPKEPPEEPERRR